MESKKSKQNLRIGCLGRFLIFSLALFMVYWLVFAPISTSSFPFSIMNRPVQIDGKINKTQSSALNKLRKESGDNIYVLAPDGDVQFLTLATPISIDGARNPQETAMQFLAQNEQIFGLTEIENQIKVEFESSDQLGNTFVHFGQVYQTIPVHGSEWIVSVDNNGAVYSVSANYDPLIEVDVNPVVDLAEAEAVVISDLNATDVIFDPSPTLEICSPRISVGSSSQNEARLAWYITVRSETLGDVWLYVVDAHQGVILASDSLILELGFHARVWEINNGLTSYVYDDKWLKDMSDYSNDALNNTKHIYDHFENSFGVDILSLQQGSEGRFAIFVYTGNCDFYAYYDPAQGTLNYCRLWVSDPDVTSHEVTHQISGALVGFSSSGEPRELNESFSDLFAAFSDPSEPWQITGPLKNDQKTIIRNLATPQAGYPLRYDDRYCNRNNLFCEKKCPSEIDGYKESYPDCGHINSVVFSHSAYLMSRNSDQPDGIPVDKLQHLYYYVLANHKLTKSSTQKMAASAILNACVIHLDQPQFDGRQISNPFTIDDCIVVNDAFVKTGLMSKINLQPENNWLFEAVQGLRRQIDEMIGDFRQEIENMLREGFAQLLQEMEKGLESFIHYLGTEISRLLLQAFQVLMTQIERQILECCNSFMVLLLLPPVVSIFLKRKRSE